MTNWLQIYAIGFILSLIYLTYLSRDKVVSRRRWYTVALCLAALWPLTMPVILPSNLFISFLAYKYSRRQSPNGRL